MALCTVTGAVYFPSGELARSVTIKFSRVDKSVNAEYLGAVVPADVYVKTDRLGQVDFQILTGKYIMAVGEYSGGAVVPEALTASIADVLTIVTPAIPVPAWLTQALAARDEAVGAADDAQDSADAAAASAAGAATAGATAGAAAAAPFATAAAASADEAFEAASEAVGAAALAVSTVGFLPRTPEQFGASIEAANNDVAISDFLSYYADADRPPYWGDEVREFRVTSQFPDIYSTPQTGVATLVRMYGGTDYRLRIGPQFGAQNIVHVAPAGSGDGITPDAPRSLSSAFTYWRSQLSNCAGTKLEFRLEAGTYTGATMRPIDMPQMDFPWRFVGPVDGGNVPTAVFDIPSFTSSRVFYRTQGGARFLGRFENLRFNGPGVAIDLRYNMEAYCNNVHYYGTKGSGDTAFVFRNGVAEFTGGRIQGANTALMFQDAYCEAGAHPDNLPQEGTEYIDCSVAVAVTRQSSGYARQNRFTGCDINIQVDRNARVRSQGNTHTNWSIAAIDADMGGLWNNDPSLPDLFPGTVNGVQVLRQRRGGIITPAISQTSSELVCNNRSVGPAIINATERTQFPTGTHAAFRVPGFWLKSPTARGTWKALMLAPAGVSALLEITGSVSTAVVASITLPSTAGAGYWEIEINFFGADGVGGQPRYFCTAHHLRNDVQTRVVSSGAFSATTTAIANDLVTEKVFPVYLTPSGVGDFTLRYFDSYISF